MGGKEFSLDKINRYFRTCSPVGMADPDGCRARDVVERLLDGDDDTTHTLLRGVLILPYLTGDFDDKHMPEYAGSVLFALLKPNGTPPPINCASLYRRCHSESLASKRVLLTWRVHPSVRPSHASSHLSMTTSFKQRAPQMARPTVLTF